MRPLRNGGKAIFPFTDKCLRHRRNHSIARRPAVLGKLGNRLSARIANSRFLGAKFPNKANFSQ